MLEKLNKIQCELKANKGQYNSFGKYKYRSCEDILEAVKPLLKETKTTLTINDEVVLIGDRYYVKATAILTDIETKETYSNSAYAREEENKKGMDASQVTGATSSYARKYALNGLLCIDDTKDNDTNELNEERTSRVEKQSVTTPTKEATSSMEQMQIKKASPNQINVLNKHYQGENLTKLLQVNNIIKLEDLPMTKASELIAKLTKKGE